MRNISLLLSRLLEGFMHILAPKDPLVLSIEKMSPAVFREEALKSPRHIEIEGTMSLFSYRANVVRKSLVELKSSRNEKISQLIGALLYEGMKAELPDLEMFYGFSSPLLVPIPITKKKQKERGFNQCELILGSFKDSPALFEIRFDILKKIRETKDQVGKTREERIKNQRGCFLVPDPSLVKNRGVIVFDDIVTTGATLFEAKRVLQKAGARHIVCISFAH